MQVAVMVLIGRCDLAWGSDNPFTTADRLLKAEDEAHLHPGGLSRGGHQREAGHGLLSGRPGVRPVGTHTHVPTADERVFPSGTGYITDLGMTGAVESVLGIRPGAVGGGLPGGLPGRYRAAEGPAKAQGAHVYAGESATGLCTAVERVDIR
ncbi:MAG: YmdB family metallophosphoesterase [Oscillospiraceae bacterium]